MIIVATATAVLICIGGGATVMLWCIRCLVDADEEANSFLGVAKAVGWFSAALGSIAVFGSAGAAIIIWQFPV